MKKSLLFILPMIFLMFSCQKDDTPSPDQNTDQTPDTTQDNSSGKLTVSAT